MSRSKKNRAEIVQTLDWRLRNFSTSAVLAASIFARKIGLSANDLKCAELLVRFGPMSAGALGEKAGLTTGAITGIVDRLEAAGWAKRVPDPDDRRRIFIHPGPQDSATMAGVYSSYMKSLNKLLDEYPDSDLQLVSDFIERLTNINFEQSQK